MLRMFERAKDGYGLSFKDSVKRALKEQLGIDALNIMRVRLGYLFFSGDAKIQVQSYPEKPAGIRANMHSLRRH